MIVDGDLSILSKFSHIIIKNKEEELAANILEANMTESSIIFFINKQAAFNNNLHMIDENMSVLGDIEVNIKTDKTKEVIKWITS